MIPLKNHEQIEIMADGGRKLAAILKSIADEVKPGIATQDLEAKAQELFEASGGEPTFLGFHGYPASICVSVNDEVVHGIPSTRIIEEGDIVGIDAGLRYKGWCTDTAITVPVGKVSDEINKLLMVTQESLSAGLNAAKPGNHVGDISAAVEAIIKKHGYGIVRDLTGHGIGKDQWEEPSIPNFGKPGTGPEIKEGMVIAVEPMVTLGSGRVKQLNDGWTIVTLDGSPAAHFEHTVAITKDGYRQIT